MPAVGKAGQMRITDLLDERSISLNSSPKDKAEALDMAAALMVKRGNISDEAAYREQIYKREEEGTTGIGEGIAIPHGKCGTVTAPGLAAMVIPDGVAFDSLDGEPVTLLFLIAAPETSDNVHLDVLSHLSVLLMRESFCSRLRQAKTKQEFLAIINREEEIDRDGISQGQSDGSMDRQKTSGSNPGDSERSDGNALEAKKTGNSGRIPKLLAVTSCPTGIAHTYMAQESLQQAAQKAGCFLKVETRGSAGARHVLTEEEIEEADCILVAADTEVPMERFEGKPVIRCRVSDGISQADLLIARALSGTVPVWQLDREGHRRNAQGHSASADHGSGAGQRSDSERSGKRFGQSRGDTASGWGHQAYQQLMNGVSHMLPFVVGGGILIALAFLIDGFAVDINTLDEAQRTAFGTITPAAALLKRIGEAAFSFMLPVLAGFIASAIGDRPALAAGFVGGMIASAGKSGFLGALAAGFVAGYLIRFLKAICERLPEAVDRIAPVLIYPVIGILLMGLLMQFVVEPVMGAVNEALVRGLSSMNSVSRLLLGFLLGGMMAVDMGGPFNKAAYVFGTAAIVSGNYEIMAAVMVGGMTPPCALALAGFVFPDRFPKAQRDAGWANLIMGFAFITEGAIPYAAADPFRVIPACVIGSGLAGLLSMQFGCTLMAPHGGIFVFPVVGHPWLYFAALAAGTAAGALLLGLLKRPASDEKRN